MILGVLGAGIVGAGIAHSAAQAGLKVRLVDVSFDKWERAQQAIGEVAGLQRLLKKRPAEQCQVAAILANISFGTELEALKEADFLVEAVSEVEEIKREVLSRR